MNKRRLSQRQQRVIQQRQASTHGALQGLLVANFGASAEVEYQNQMYQCQLRQNLGALVCGDIVEFEADSANTGVILNRLKRKSCLGRPDSQGRLKPIAANIDQIIIVIAPQPEINFVLLDSYLVLAESLNLDAVIILNKIDLLTQSQQQKVLAQLSTYQDLDYSVFAISVHEKQGLDELIDVFSAKTQVIVGQSGVGKSSLIHYLIPDIDIRIGALTKLSSKGSHTTTTARFYHARFGEIIDSPGIRELGLWQMNANEIAAGFREFKALKPCKFRDCRHRDDMGCALREAVKSGQISASRFQSFEKLCEKI